MLRWVLAVLLTFASLTGARADDFELPGLANDAQAYADSLSRRFPAGASAAQRRSAETQANAAVARRDWPAAVTAMEMRASQGEVGPEVWRLLANAQLRRTPPDAQKALLAAWLAFSGADPGEEEVAPLLLLAEALGKLDRNAQAVQALEQVVQRAPDNADYKRMLAEAQQAVGLLVRRARSEAESDPPRACIDFTVPPRRADLNPADWLRIEPAVPGAAITREGDQLCVSGLPSGVTSRLILRAGLPGEGGLVLAKETVINVAMPNRRPRIAFDTRLFVLPRGQTPAISLTTINLSAVSLKLVRLSERNIASLLRDQRLGDPLEVWTARYMADQTGRTVWEGRADIPAWEANKPARTALPLPEALASAGPGLYALIVGAGDGTSRGVQGAVQVILRTDLAPTVWRGSDGLTVQVRGYGDAAVRPAIRLALLARNNDILAEATTDPQGVARFPAPLLAGEGPLAPAALHAFGPDDDFAALDLNAASFDLSDRGVEGMKHPGPLDAYVWLDRGIYRPGETVQVMALVRDAAGLPAELPMQVTVRRPNGQVFLRTTPKPLAEASLHLPVALSAGAAAGTWSVELQAEPEGPAIGRTEFRVDAFVPDRMAVDLGAVPKELIAGTADSLPVTARFLYGAPGAGLTGRASLRLVPNPNPSPALAGYRIGLVGELYAPESREIALPATDAQGRTSVPLLVAKAPDTTQPLMAEIDIGIDDPAGRASRTQATIPLRPATPLIGLKPLFTGDAIDAQAEAAFDIAAVSPAGARMALAAKLRLVRERPDWRLVTRGSLARYETVWRDEPLESRDIAIPAGEPLRFAKTLDFGRYRLEVIQAGGLAATSIRFRAGWAGSDSPDVPDRVDVSADRRNVPVGESVKIHIAPPFAGRATHAVLSDRVLALRTLDVPAAGLDVDVPVEAGWGPGAYVAVHLFRPAGSRPPRAIGLVWVGVDPAARTLAMSIGTPERASPRAALAVPVTATPGAWVSLAAVDEGILRLTKFVSPDPKPHFLGRRRLGLDIRDDWGRLIAPAEGTATLLRQGGDEGGFVLPDIPIRTVTLFAPPIQAGPDGIARFSLDIPDFNGEVRLMAVGWQGPRIGAASQPITIRDPLVAEALLPRFLAPRDEARLAVLLHNIDLPGGDISVALTTEGPLELAGPTTLTAALAQGARGLPTTTLRATGVGRGVVRMDIAGPGGFRLTRESAITIRPARPPASLLAGRDLAPGAEARLDPAAARFLPGSWRATASFGAPVRYDVAGLVAALDAYPMACLEQSVSRGLPLALLPDGPLAGPDRPGRLAAQVSAVLDRQRFDGAFGLWSAGGEAEPWLTPYALEFLLRARKSGAAVPDVAIADALKFLADAAESDSSLPAEMANQAYRLYVLALAGKGRPGAARVLAESLSRLPTPLARAHLAAALAMAQDQPRAEAAFAAALAAPARQWWREDYGSALRDQAAIAVLLKESGLLPDRLARLTAALPGTDLSPAALSTQEQAWAASAAAVLGRDGTPVHLLLNGADLTAAQITTSLTAPATVRNLGERAVWQAVSVSGVPAEALPAARAGMRVTRRFLALDGTPLDLDSVKQNTVFLLLLEGRAETGQAHRVLLTQGLPAGWEIAGRFGAGQPTAAPFLGALTDAEAQPAADDRYAGVIALTPEKPDFRLAVRLRAVTPGTYELPGADVADMYRPTVFARQAAGRIKVLPVE
jgi:uncharacterized protein YfaS (alpha-2-macroglobulin family)